MKNISEIKASITRLKKPQKPLIKQFNSSQNGEIITGLVIFEDGQMYMLVRDKRKGHYKWSEFTWLKNEGVEILKDLIRNEFMNLDHRKLKEASSQNLLIWEVTLDEKTTEIQLHSGSYANLPKVFEKVDKLINKYMYRMNEKVED